MTNQRPGTATAWCFIGRAAPFFVAFAIGTLPRTADATDNCTPMVAQIVSVQGQIELLRVKQTQWQAARLDDKLCAGDTLRVAARGRAALRLQNQSVLRLDQATTLTLAGLDDEKASLIDMLSGAIHVLTRTAKPFKVKTPFLNAGIEGTEFFVGLAQASTTVVVFEGKVSASNEQGNLLLADGEAAIAQKNQAPRKTLLIRPLDAVQWALYYPAVLDAPSTQCASELLMLGRADEAGLEIERVLKLNPRDSNAYASQSIIALAQNDKMRALSLAEQAVQLDPASPGAKIALSYAQQAYFRIEDALSAMKEAVEQNPRNALAWARLAELHLSTGNLNAALEAAQRANDLNPGLAKTQTVLGFVHLTRIDTTAAKAAFQRAITLDQADPMPRLGLGLAYIREGQLEAGRVEIEIAAGLDPGNSLIRSYLGKAYFEEKRDQLAATQFELAKARDPMDPTPWFYDAIRKQTENRPVEALHDLEQSIKLNDNRAVYRSQLLLDSDEAVRGTSMARIYNDLGFEQLAVNEATKSLSADPTNYSSHRFLSDAYANIPRHEIARVSELLQSQLLQPININPVQPRMAVTDLNIVTGAGPAEAAFNEFTPMFERNRPQLNVSGLVGNNDTLSDEIVFSGVRDRLSYSVGQFFYKSDGFRDNNDLEHKIYNAFLQYAVTPQFNVQAEVRSRRTETGDLEMNFDPDDFLPENRHRVEQDTLRLGARFSPTLQDDLLVSYFYGNRKETNTEPLPPSHYFLDREFQDEGYQLEGQYLFRGEHFNLTAGAGTYSIDLEVEYTFTPCDFGPPCSFDVLDSTGKRSNAYLYTDIRFPANMTWTLGLGYDASEDGPNERNEWNPKLGLQWQIADWLRFRAAYFETLKPVLIVDQTLEPTQVAGFNQMFDDFNITWAKRRGIGLDADLAKGMYGGIEWSKRDLEVPHILFGPDPVIEPQEERLYRAYWYWAFHRDWAMSIDAQYEELSRDSDPAFYSSVPRRIETFSAPIGLRYFQKSGLFASLTGTYVRQEVERFPGTDLAQGEDSFFLVDASIGYRLPQRKGIISVEAQNIFDEDFFYRNEYLYKTEPSNPRFVPDRTVLMRLMFNF